MTDIDDKGYPLYENYKEVVNKIMDNSVKYTLTKEKIKEIKRGINKSNKMPGCKFVLNKADPSHPRLLVIYTWISGRVETGNTCIEYKLFTENATTRQIMMQAAACLYGKDVLKDGALEIRNELIELAWLIADALNPGNVRISHNDMVIFT